VEENDGKRGGQRWATTMHSDIIGTSQITKLKDLRDHQKILAKLPGAVGIC
jgi:hypothetical protein